MLEPHPSRCLPSELYGFHAPSAHAHYDVRWGTSDEVVDYSHFAWNMFRSLSITLRYNVLPLLNIRLIFPHIFDPSRSLHEFLSQLQHSLVKFLNIDNCSLHMYYCVKCIIFGLVGHIRTRKTHKISPSLSIATFIGNVLEHRELLTSHVLLHELWDWEHTHIRVTDEDFTLLSN